MPGDVGVARPDRKARGVLGASVEGKGGVEGRLVQPGGEHAVPEPRLPRDHLGLQAEVIRQVVDPQPEAGLRVAGIALEHLREVVDRVQWALLDRHDVRIAEHERAAHAEPVEHPARPQRLVTEVLAEADHVVRGLVVELEQGRVRGVVVDQVDALAPGSFQIVEERKQRGQAVPAIDEDGDLVHRTKQSSAGH